MIVEIQKNEKHDVRAEVIEQVARLLCKADGKDPDHDWRDGGTNFLIVAVDYPGNLEWSRYKSKAEERLNELFGGHR